MLLSALSSTLRWLFNEYHASEYTLCNKLLLYKTSAFNPAATNIGYTYVNGSADINFAKRRVKTIRNILSAKYSFTNKMASLSGQGRYYLSSVENSEFLCCSAMVSVQLHTGFHPDVNQNVNFSISIWYILVLRPWQLPL